ncbi:hypothetical protein Afil01_39960 [Actinorhabdospora filicis]|uniref:Uncharacterized protein n=1 Tax=Actinorhabdospora filicis TaxID=1785913 RepID=A0A9W6WA14_9ACTN|nr:hypothetical protein [Actinorhabdospora filicis]GLZ79189.1 hypothetical protein Afil01_39960 [Actinorhabdospora filicis]
MSDGTWPDGEPSYEPEDIGADGYDVSGDESAYHHGELDDTVDLQLGDDDEPGAGLDLTDHTDLPDDGDDLGVDGLDDDPLADPGRDVGEPVDETPWFAPDLAEEPVLGADPDHDDLVDAEDWSQDAFPPELDFEDPPEPVDGLPWSDPSLLGGLDDDTPDDGEPEYAAPDVADLLDYSGAEAPAGGDVWAELLGSTDPATSGLARWWAPSR